MGTAIKERVSLSRMEAASRKRSSAAASAQITARPRSRTCSATVWLTTARPSLGPRLVCTTSSSSSPASSSRAAKPRSHWVTSRISASTRSSITRPSVSLWTALLTSCSTAKSRVRRRMDSSVSARADSSVSSPSPSDRKYSAARMPPSTGASTSAMGFTRAGAVPVASRCTVRRSRPLPVPTTVMRVLPRPTTLPDDSGATPWIGASSTVVPLGPPRSCT